MKSERGNVTIIAVAVVALACMLCLGVARVSGAVGLKSRADTAADAAALAAADKLALGSSDDDARTAASAAAADNGATLMSCSCSADVAEVTVEIDGLSGHAFGYARAEVDLRALPPPVR